METATQSNALMERFRTFGADLALVNANGFTMSTEQPQIRAVAAKDGRIGAAGNDHSIRRRCNTCIVCGESAGDDA